MPWYETVRRWGQTNLTEDDPGTIDMDFWRDYWKKMRLGGVIVNAGGIVAYYPSHFPLHYRASGLREGDDLFGSFSQAAKSEGLAVVARMDCNRAAQDFYREHPDWFCVDRDGVPYQSQGRYFSCVNTDYYKQYIPDILTEIIHAYHPDGFADNSWSGIRKNRICYCPRCRKLFREKTGFSLPEAVNWDDPVFRAYVRWSYDCREENWRLFNRITRQEGGEDCLWVGMVHADPHILEGHYVDLRHIARQTPVLFTDHQSRNALDGFEQNYVNGALLHGLCGESALIPESTAHYVTGARTFRLSAMPAAEVQTWLACGMAGGVSPWYHHIGGSRADRRKFDSTMDLMRWHAASEEYLYHRENMADIALVWSQDNADFYGRDQAVQRVALPWRGFTAAMRDSRMPYAPLHLDDLPEQAERFRLLVLPDVAAMSDHQLDALCSYLRCGGSLVMTGNTGLLDEDGQPRTASSLWEVLGLNADQAASVENSPCSGWESCQYHTYLALGSERHPILSGFEQTDIIGFGGHCVHVDTRGMLQPLCGMIPAFPIYPPEFSAMPRPRPEESPIFAGSTPWGGRVVYFAADIDRCFGAERLPDHGRLLSNAIDWALHGKRQIEVRGSGMLHLSLYRQGNRRIVHLVNLSGRDSLPGRLPELLPVHDLELRLPCSGDVRIYSLTHRRDLPVRCQNGRACVTVEKIELHEVLLVEEHI